jgi:D-lactate dehydrogenase
MKIAFFDAHTFERDIFLEENRNHKHELRFIDAKVTPETVALASGIPCVCIFVNDVLSSTALSLLRNGGTELIALRSAGYNHVDLVAARKLGFTVVRVPEYSPFAVAEHAVALLLTMNRKIHRAFNRVREGNFSLDGMVGFDVHGKTVGVIGVGKIGRAFARILHGFGAKLLLFDRDHDEAFAQTLDATYVELEELFSASDIISLHVPLTADTTHLINDRSLAMMKKGAMLINTSRGKLIDTAALIRGLKSGHIGSAGLDVYEEEEGLYFHDHSGEILSDDVFARLMTFPNVLITGHQGFLTTEALRNIAETTLTSISDFEAGRKELSNRLY